MNTMKSMTRKDCGENGAAQCSIVNKNSVADLQEQDVISGSSTLSLPRVINVQFLLQPHQKYYIAQYEELRFS